MVFADLRVHGALAVRADRAVEVERRVAFDHGFERLEDEVRRRRATGHIELDGHAAVEWLSRREQFGKDAALRGVEAVAGVRQPADPAIDRAGPHRDDLPAGAGDLKGDLSLFRVADAAAREHYVGWRHRTAVYEDARKRDGVLAQKRDEGLPDGEERVLAPSAGAESGRCDIHQFLNSMRTLQERGPQ